MERFENAQKGDEVYCRIHGMGVIAYIDDSNPDYPVTCEFSAYDSLKRYMLDGKWWTPAVEPILFYRSGDDLYLTERPEKVELDYKAELSRVAKELNQLRASIESFLHPARGMAERE